MANITGYNRKLAVILRKNGLVEEGPFQQLADKAAAEKMAECAIQTGLAMGLIFFYAPIEADQGFVQKIFYLHVPLAIVALSGWVAGGVFGVFERGEHLVRLDAVLRELDVKEQPRRLLILFMTSESGI